MISSQPDERLEIVAYHPRKRLAFKVLVFFLLVSAALGGYYYGRWEAASGKQPLYSTPTTHETRQLRQTLEAQEEELNDLRRQILIAESSHAVDLSAYQEVQQTVLNLNARIARLENELHFYQRVMAPETVDQGLRIDRLNLQATDAPNTYDYQLVITQVTDQNQFIEGHALISLVGQRGQTRNLTLPLSEVAKNFEDSSVRFRFRFFQNIAGRLTLPEDFQPEKVQVILQSTGPRAMRIEQEFDWATQEAL